MNNNRLLHYPSKDARARFRGLSSELRKFTTHFASQRRFKKNLVKNSNPFLMKRITCVTALSIELRIACPLQVPTSPNALS